MEVVILGSGTSHGVPVIACDCDVCRSSDPKDKRTRASLLVRHAGLELLIDTAPEFRLQAVREGIKRLDALFYTHPHADHLHGLDDIRPLTRKHPATVYGSRETLDELTRRFDYIFARTQPGGGKPQIRLEEIPEAGLVLEGLRIMPIPIFHGELPIYGFRLGKTAYLTDCSRIPESSYPLLEGLELLIIGALRYRPHPTHFSFDEAAAEARRIGAERTLVTHLCHDASHEEIGSYLAGKLSPGEAKKIEPAHDGLCLRVGI